LFGVCLGAAAAGGQTYQGVELVSARLVSDSETVVPGRPVTIGLHLKKAKGWHTYWEYPGDSGLPTSLELALPEGFRATDWQWPLPLKMMETGDLEVYAYKDEVLLVARVFPPADLTGEKVEFKGKAEWLVCEAICIPGSAEVGLTLDVGREVRPSADRALFERFVPDIPAPLRGREGEPVQVEWQRERDALIVDISGPSEWNYEFFPVPGDGVVLGHPAAVNAPNNAVARIRLPFTAAPEGLTRIPGVVVATDAEGKRHAWRVAGR
jgi:DsbC/DsbD-like thiol-disulfide interchange protein